MTEEVNPDLVVPFQMREWMRKVEVFCDKVDAYLTEVEQRLQVLEAHAWARS